jgi:hypothetical protein
MMNILDKTVHYFKTEKVERRRLTYNSFISGNVLYYNGSSIAKWRNGEIYIRYVEPSKPVISRLKALGANICIQNKRVYKDKLPLSSHDWHKL